MHIGIAGPISTESVLLLLGGDVPPLAGYGGSPLMGTLIQALLDRGHQVTGYTLDRDLMPGTRARSFGTDRFRLYYVPMRKRSMRPNGRHLGRIMDLYRMERRELSASMNESRPDVVHAHWLYEFALAAIESRIPHLVTAHDSPAKVLRYMPNLYRLGRYVMARRTLRRAKMLTAVSEYLRSELRDLASISIDVVANPLPKALCEREAARTAARESMSIKVGMVLNGWSRFKNPQPAIEGFSNFRRDSPDAELHLFGHDFEVGGKGSVWCKKQGLESGLLFHGPIPHDALLDKLIDLDVLLHPALEETFGMAVAEAMALELPVIGGRQTGAIPWLLGDGEAGMLVDVTSASEISMALKDLGASPNVRHKLGAAGRKRVARLCEPDAVVAEYERCYRKAIESSSIGAAGGR